MADYLLLETGDKIILEDASGNLLLEDGVSEGSETLMSRVSISVPIIIFLVLSLMELGEQSG